MQHGNDKGERKRRWREVVGCDWPGERHRGPHGRYWTGKTWPGAKFPFTHYEFRPSKPKEKK